MSDPRRECPAHRHLPSPLRPATCATCHPIDLRESLPSSAMPQTSATVDLLSDVVDALREQLNAEKARTTDLNGQLCRVREALESFRQKNRELSRELKKTALERDALRNLIDGAGGV